MGGGGGGRTKLLTVVFYTLIKRTGLMKECNDLYQFKIAQFSSSFYISYHFFKNHLSLCSANSKLLTHVKGLPLV